MKRLALLVLAALATACVAAAVAQACDDGPNAVNLVIPARTKAALRPAFLAGTQLAAARVGAPVAGRTYYGYDVGIYYAVATFVVDGRPTEPAIFSDQGRSVWKLLRVTHGGVCSGVVPADLIRQWWLRRWQEGCFVEP